MRAFRDYDKVQAYSDAQQLPTGGYIARIMGAEEKDYGDTSVLLVSVDIAEGEFKGYYKDRYASDKNNPDRKWKGVARFYVPKDDGTEQDEWTKRAFKTCIEAVEDSNDGYKWDWDETKLKGKTVGILVRQKEYDFNDRRGWAPEIFKFMAADAIRNNKFKTPEDKPLKGNASTSKPSASAANNTADVDDDLPF